MNLLNSIIAMNIFGDTFGKLFTVIWDAIKWVGRQIGRFFTWLGQLIWDAIIWLGNLLKELFFKLLDLLLAFFEVIYALIDGFFYFLYQVGLIAVKVFILFWEVAKLIYAFFIGLGKTLASFSYTPQAGSGHGYSHMIGRIFNALEPMQLNVVAYILLFVIWLFTAIQVIRLLSGLRVGGE